MDSSKLAFKQTMGDFPQNLPPSQEYLILSFSPGSISLQQRWRNNGLSADFMADYLSTFFVSEEDQPETEKQREIKGAVSYVANELLENGMKYCVRNSTVPISIQIHLTPNIIVLQLTNSISIEQTHHFQVQIERLLAGDPSEMYIAQLEQNALEENHLRSNLGLLTMLNDYKAKIGWNFKPSSEQPELIAVTTMVQLLI